MREGKSRGAGRSPVAQRSTHVRSIISLALAALASLPALAIAKVYLARRRIATERSGLARTFMARAPRSLRLTVIGLSGCAFGALLFAIASWARQL